MLRRQIAYAWTIVRRQKQSLQRVFRHDNAALDPLDQLTKLALPPRLRWFGKIDARIEFAVAFENLIIAPCHYITIIGKVCKILNYPRDIEINPGNLVLIGARNIKKLCRITPLSKHHDGYRNRRAWIDAFGKRHNAFNHSTSHEIASVRCALRTAQCGTRHDDHGPSSIFQCRNRLRREEPFRRNKGDRRKVGECLCERLPHVIEV